MAANADVKKVGQWGDLFNLANVCIHASLLPNGKILYWGRRSDPKSDDFGTLSEHFTQAYLLDLNSKQSQATKTQPKRFGSGEDVNLFCSGHCIQPDGSVFIAGGHLNDGNGVNQACVYDPATDTFIAKPLMNNGRWYPSAITLPDGTAFVEGGSYSKDPVNHPETSAPNIFPEIWYNNTSTWRPVGQDDGANYPKLHLAPDGRVFKAGWKTTSQFLDLELGPNGIVGTWKSGPDRTAKDREYGSSVMYDSGKIIYTGGGNTKDGVDDAIHGEPTDMVELIDLNEVTPKWTTVTSMHFKRRQHNATVLPDGTVLVTGGTQGEGFNNVSPGQPVHTPELWDPLSKTWTQMADEAADRCYHCIALLLPDGQVLSAGGGEWEPSPPGGKPNAAKDSLTNAQLFKPPYLLKKDESARPVISTAPSEINYGDKFDVTLKSTVQIKTVSWVRLGSVTHTTNMNQVLVFLEIQNQDGPKVTIKAPTNFHITPPGHYMLFVLDQDGVPSVAPIIRIGSKDTPAPSTFARTREQDDRLSLPALNDKIIAEETRIPVIVGLTSVCPYGLGPCWVGAYNALQQISDIDVVRPVPDQDNSVAFVYLKQEILPDIDKWRSEFHDTANGSYVIRGIEMTVSGVVTKINDGANEQLVMAETSTRPEVILAPYQETNSIRYDSKTREPKPISDEEAGTYAQLSAALADHPAGLTLKAEGTLQKLGDDKFSLAIRSGEVGDGAAGSL